MIASKNVYNEMRGTNRKEETRTCAKLMVDNKVFLGELGKDGKYAANRETE